jgi:type III pantothenate kinase
MVLPGAWPEQRDFTRFHRRACGGRNGRGYDPAMLLAIDIGNTNLSLGWFRGGTLIGTRRAATVAATTTDELEVLLDGLLGLDGRGFADVTGLVCASVVPALSTRLEAVAARHERSVLLATAGTIPIPIRVDRPVEVGADRLVNALAAARLHGTPAVVADLGTATTVDAVATDGAFLGGAIAPGLALGLEALVTGTARLPRVELRVPDRVIGRDTVAAMQAGAVLGYQALVGGLVARMRREVGDQLRIPADGVRTILTGGLSAGAWAAGIEGIEIVDPDLTLKGLAILHAEVAGGEPLALGLG